MPLLTTTIPNGVNTANAGPYGDALTQELYPEIEKRFRGIGQAWGRVVFGSSTGGWMTLAQQIFYPDYFGGAWGFCPDPVDFHAFQRVLVQTGRDRAMMTECNGLFQSKHCSRDGISTDRSSSGVSAGTPVSN